MTKSNDDARLRLYPIRGYNRYCGPAALSAVLDITTDEAAKRVRTVSPHRRMVKTCSTSEVLKVLRQSNVRAVKIPPFSASVKALLKHVDFYEVGIYLVTLTSHFIVARRNHFFMGRPQWQFVDNHWKTLTYLDKAPKWQSRRVAEMHYLVRPDAGEATGAVSAQLAAQKGSNNDGPPELLQLFLPK